MAQSYMEMIYIDSEDLAQHTGAAAVRASNAETWAEFKSYRRYAVDIKTATFLLDYHNAKGDLADTIPLDAVGFTAITGKPVLTEKEYRAIDDAYWAEVIRERKAATPTGAKS